MADDIRTIIERYDVDGNIYEVVAQTDHENIGGYLVPQFIYDEKPGLIAKIQRIFKCERGWEKVNYPEKLRALLEKVDLHNG